MLESGNSCCSVSLNWLEVYDENDVIKWTTVARKNWKWFNRIIFSDCLMRLNTINIINEINLTYFINSITLKHVSENSSPLHTAWRKLESDREYCVLKWNPKGFLR